MNKTMEGYQQQDAVVRIPPNAAECTQIVDRPDTGRDNSGQQVFQGIPLSPGTGLGRGCFYRTPAANQHVAGSADDETRHLCNALSEVSVYLDKLARDADRRLNQSAGNIFRAQRMLLDDPVLIESLENTISELGCNAEAAITQTFGRLADELLAAGTDIIRERAEDFTELKNLICARLVRQQAHVYCQDVAYCQPGICLNANDHILIATRLIPGTTIGADCHTMGFVVETGGPSSHAAILARMMGLPAVSGIPDAVSSIPIGSQILVDGNSGKVFVNPTRDTLSRYRNCNHDVTIETIVAPVPQLRIMADLDQTGDIGRALAARAEGVGLYRSETEALMQQRSLSEAEQVDRYGRLLEAFPNDPVCVRLLDLGADKAADWLQLPAEDNPALGCRGARLLLERPELLRTQARALARSALRRELKVLYPMVHSVDQFLQLRALFDAAICDLPDAQLSHGVMFEVPSACIDARAIFKHADFGRIGTNDLTQYLFAADRTNSSLDQHELFRQPALWTLIKAIVAAATEANKPLSICGELAADPGYTRRIMQAGITEISTCPRHIAALRRAVG